MRAPIISLALYLSALLASPFAHAETATLQHDNSGNVTQRSVTNGTTTQTTTYTYDALNRLKTEAGAAKTQTFEYDENGNRKSDGAGNYTYETTSNRMSTQLGLAVTFDAAGNLTADGTGRTFTYNEANQMDQVFQGGVLQATYEYDANGLRLSKTTTASAPQGAQTVVYFYGLQGHLLAETSGTGTPIRTYAWRDDVPVAQIEHVSGTDKFLYFETDHLNTPRAAMDETGKVVWRWESDAFGTTLPNEDQDGDSVKVTVNLRFPGQYYDAESGLHYNHHRYYIPELGRYLTSDPIGLEGGINTFGYVEGNPVRFVDPLGLVIPAAASAAGSGSSVLGAGAGITGGGKGTGKGKNADDPLGIGGKAGSTIVWPGGAPPSTPVMIPATASAPNFPTGKDPRNCEQQHSTDLERCETMTETSCHIGIDFDRLFCRFKAFNRYRACTRMNNAAGRNPDGD